MKETSGTSCALFTFIRVTGSKWFCLFFPMQIATIPRTYIPFSRLACPYPSFLSLCVRSLEWHSTATATAASMRLSKRVVLRRLLLRPNGVDQPLPPAQHGDGRVDQALLFCWWRCPWRD